MDEIKVFKCKLLICSNFNSWTFQYFGGNSVSTGKKAVSAQLINGLIWRTLLITGRYGDYSLTAGTDRRMVLTVCHAWSGTFISSGSNQL